MANVIRVSPEVYSRLEKLARGFDTPSNVISRLLDHHERCDLKSLVPSEQKTEQNTSVPGFGTRNTTKFRFNGITHGKNRLVLAVVKQYVFSNPETKYKDLLIVFPKQLQGSMGVFSSKEKAVEIYERTGHKRHFIKDNEIIHLADGEVAVCTQWGSGNIEDFVSEAQKLGYKIEPTNN